MNYAGSKFVQNHKIHVVSIDNEMGFMNVDKGLYFSADEVGTRIWDILIEPKSINEIVDILLTEYDIHEKQCREDVEDFIRKMVSHELLLLTNT